MGGFKGGRGGLGKDEGRLMGDLKGGRGEGKGGLMEGRGVGERRSRSG